MPDGSYRRIPLHRRDGAIVAYALVDEQDARLAESSWFLHGNGYAARNAPHPAGDGRRMLVLLHREVLGLTLGDGIEGDHENGDRLDCRRSNLRQATHALNGQNIVRAGGTSRFRGVAWSKPRGRWRAQAQLNGRRVHLGYFADELDAAAAVADWRGEHMPFANEQRHAVPVAA